MKIVPITPEPTIEPNALIVEFLELLLGEAKQGNILDIACVYLDEDGTNLSFYTCEDDNELKMYGAFVLACDQFKREVVELNEYEEED